MRDQVQENTGKILEINLSESTVKKVELKKEIKDKYIGGAALGAALIYQKMNGKPIEPLSPKNLLVFSVGPITGSLFPFSSRFFVCGISPLTNGWGQGSSGGFFGPELRRSGYDAIVIEGRANSPKYIIINPESVEIKDATSLWGKGTYETETMIKKMHPGYRVACIGPAGENEVKYAAIMNDGGRVVGRTGLGAVMGNKKLKAIAVRGKSPQPTKDFIELIKAYNKKIVKTTSYEALHKYGTAGSLGPLMDYGDVPVKNFSKGSWDDEKIKKIDGIKMADTILVGNYHCEGCPVGCGRKVKVESEKYGNFSGSGPEYETVAAFGPLLLNDDLVAIAKINHLCDDYGMDTISTGVTIAFLIECIEKGIVEKVPGIDLTWGNAEAVIKVIGLIAHRRGIGNQLAEGTRRLAKVIGRGAEKFAMHVKGLEFPMHDPRAFESWALAFATCNRGACHTTASTYYIEKGLTFPGVGLPKALDRFDVNSKPKAVKIIQDMCEYFDTLVMCRFCLYGGIRVNDTLKILEALTGRKMHIEDAMKVGERSFNLKRYINYIQGFNGMQDTLPQRSFEPLKDGGTHGHTPTLGRNLEEYYRLRGWKQDGTIPNDKLKELEII